MAPRQPHETRRRILDAAFWEIYRNGYQGASIDRILEGTGITKGALFHHFSNKQQLGQAVIDELISAWMQEHWISPAEGLSDPIAGVPGMIQAYLERSPEEIIRGGCPWNNLAQEMAGIDEGFRLRLDAIATAWRTALSESWRRGQANGLVSDGVDPDDAAALVVSVTLGLLGTAKAAKSREPAGRSLAALTHFLHGLRS